MGKQRIGEADNKHDENHLKPFKQGHLDGLCGIYAIINGLRSVLGRRFPEGKCQQLFDLLTQYAIKEQGMLNLISEGVGQRQMQQLLALTLEILEEYFSGRRMPKMTMSQPWRTKTSRVGVDFTDYIQKHLVQNHSAVIIGVEHPICHWSVVRAINSDSLQFFDSDKLKGPIKGQLKITTEYCAWDHHLIVFPQSVFLLSTVHRGEGTF